MAVPVGTGKAKKDHKFDLGSESPPVLVECKCHTWTEGGNAPSAKLTVWNEAMLYFACAPLKYRKLLVVQRSLRGPETLAEHYLKRYRHLVPGGVELWEFDSVTRQGRLLYKSQEAEGGARAEEAKVMDPTPTDTAPTRCPELYQAATQQWAHAEQIRWTLLYNYLMASTILLLAWATVYAAHSAFRSRPWLLALLAAAGAIVSLAWVGLGLRASSFVDAYAQTGKALEGPLGANGPFARAQQHREGLKGWSACINSRRVVAGVPGLFSALYLVLCCLAVKWILGA
ncbi:MAG TPA: hypothetical protein VN953_05395 [Gemmatimonadales bacterium]|nr:hypothetical protein [Gemmatimonadales bacterium]